MLRPGKDFLLEIGVESLPARFLRPGLDQLAEKIEAALAENRLTFESISRYGTPRRLAVLVRGLADKSETLSKTVQGPPVARWKNTDGSWTREAAGFAGKHGLKPEDLQTASTPKGEFLAAKIVLPGRKAEDILAQVLPGLIASLEFPKSMEWEPSRMRFARPIRRVAALLGGKVVSFRVADIKSGRLIGTLASEGKKPATLRDASAYPRTLGMLLVQADLADRKDCLLKKLEQTARHLGARVDLDEELIDETVCMTEHPVPVSGTFKEEFLSLPPALLAMVLKKQLKFFTVSGKDGSLKAAFVGVRDGISEGQALVREGYQRVLAARLSDAVFFFERDLRAPLAAKLPGLEALGYQKDLGSMAQKAERVRALSEKLCGLLRSERPVNEKAVEDIARLCYADLVCEVVKEFPELQGAMGGVYARKEGLDERVALGLEQFYFPLFGKAPIPATEEGAVVSLAAKLDSLAGCFALGLEPTGKADPYALRRHALGLLRILLEKQFPFNAEELALWALELQPLTLDEKSKRAAAGKITEFLWGRAQSFFEEMGYRVDEIRAVRRGALEDVPRALLRLAALASIRRHPDFDALSAAFKRASNILKQAAAGACANGEISLDEAALSEPAEKDLCAALERAEDLAHGEFAKRDYEAGLRILVGIKPALDKFFDDVMVMAEDPAARRARLALLSRLVGLFKEAADLSEIQPAAAAR